MSALFLSAEPTELTVSATSPHVISTDSNMAFSASLVLHELSLLSHALFYGAHNLIDLNRVFME